ncbi:autoinducer 2 ABC transporter substrate-binding protein [Brevibacillus nitrificans]|uniref:autoinducer 2 ABC transporter substrate-binding protein n=1 Tax=Brevibacillus nitrificans TaxID=651560 RepID=UPI002618B3D6|nr:autoinducer 2 ABC transporter substrate-binding protein [Brevibacillus nitrificans]MED1791432.1 autoinducer 2 ABC transporter substrate-binding protein [Brevibacillus nitrificans]
MMNRQRRNLTLVSLMLAVLLLLLSACSGGVSTQPQDQTGQQASGKKYKIATVVKLTGVAWFDRMNEGIKKFGEETGNETFMQGPQKADAALQVQIIEDLIAQKVDAITVVPFSAEALEPVLKKAREKGIVVITHEADGFENTDFNIEAFDNLDYGAFLMDSLAKSMGEQGEYMTTVGSLTTKSHMQWEEGAYKRQQEKYPNMKAVARKLETNDDQKTASEKFRETLKAYPNLKGFQGASGNDAAGAALAVEEMGLQGKVSVVGTSVPSVSKQYLDSGAMSMIGFWDPADAGYVMNKLAVMVLDGKKADIKEGANLGVKGYESIKVVNDKYLFGSAWVGVGKDNMNDYNF